ncbi:MAG: LuxR C-terminal-related transcriptional regulator [Terriglobia bacterium]
MKKKISILIVDREVIFRFGLRRLLGAEEDFRVAGEAENITQAIHMTRQLKPALIFFQAELAAGEAAGLLLRLRAASAGCKVVITAGAVAEGESLRFTRAGASGVILKSVDPILWVKCARKVMDNEIWLPKRDVAKMAQLLEAAPLNLPRPADTLTQREKVIVSYLVQGWRNREIAQHLSISEQTVKNHLRAVYDKIGVSDRLELALYVIYQRLELPPVVLTSLDAG